MRCRGGYKNVFTSINVYLMAEPWWLVIGELLIAISTHLASIFTTYHSL